MKKTDSSQEYNLAISHCNVESWMTCGICGEQARSSIPLDLSLEDRSDWVCRACGEIHDPAMVRILDWLYDTQEGNKIIEFALTH